MPQEFDAIIVGAGPAGCACAYLLAKAGLDVLVTERGGFAGAKNMWGGAFYGPVLNELFPEFWKEAPVERPVTRHRYSLLSGEGCLSVDYAHPKFNRPPYNGFTMFRAKFDNWFAEKVQQAGAIVATGLQADDLLWDKNRVAGVRAGGDDLPAKVVIACDGVNSMMAKKAGLRGELQPQDIKQGVKEVLRFAPGVIEERFNLQDGGGIDWEFIGDCTRGLPGGAFIYTNKESLSVGVVVSLKSLIDQGVRADDLLQDFKRHPAVAGLLEGSELAEYSAHLIPVSGIAMMPSRLYADGFLVAGDAAALVLGTGLALEGANFAAASGMAAAKTVIKAKQASDFSAITLSSYQKLLEEGFVMKDLKTHRLAPHFLENERIYTAWPKFACNLAEKVFTSDGEPRRKTWELLKDEMKGEGAVSFVQMAKDLFDAGRAL